MSRQNLLTTICDAASAPVWYLHRNDVAEWGIIMPQTEEDLKRLLEKANTLPQRPGVYIMRGSGGGVVYVGKSRKLKNRVTQYFRNGEKTAKTDKMVSAVRDFDYYVCDTEIEALTLENTLIKQYTPKYNIKLKDAKSYPYIKITADEYPRLVMTRKRDDDRCKYYGPYSGVATVFSVINTLSAALELPTCKKKFPADIGKERPCIYYQMKRCCGVCTGKVSREDYLDKIKYASDILRGNTADVRAELTQKMYRLSDEERYEAAAKCRDTVSALEKLSQKQKVVAAPGVEHDIIGLYSDDLCTAISVFYIRDGVITDRSEYVFGADRIIDESNISSFICEHYRIREYIPREILLSFEIPDEESSLTEEYLSEISDHKVHLRTPERGDLRTLCEMVRDNAKEKAKLYVIENEKDERTLLRLAQLLNLEVYPERIEAYDISNIGHEHISAGMIVTDGTKFKKSDYRSFKIRSVTDKPDDYASMRETIERRLEHLKDEDGSFSVYPDLILLDGGRGHVSVVKQLLREKKIDIPVFGMVKDDFHKTRALCDENHEIGIAKENAVFVFIYKIQEEVHRYTVSRMDAAKRNTLTNSSLTKINGIGAVKAKALLSHFGTLTGIKTASVEELSSVKGLSEKDALEVYKYFESKRTVKT